MHAERGLPIEVLIDYMALVQQGDPTIEARKETLMEQRELLVAGMAQMQKTLDILDHKIEVYEKSILKKEKRNDPNREIKKCQNVNIDNWMFSV